MSPISRASWQIHFCVVLWGFTAIFGKLISLGTLSLVWWRMMLVAGSLALVPRFWRGVSKLPARLIAIYAGIGMVVALHWLAFYESIRLANASVAATCLALTPVFLAFIEPFLVGRRFDPREVLFGLAAIPGVILVVGGTPTEMRLGIAVGILFHRHQRRARRHGSGDECRLAAREHRRATVCYRSGVRDAVDS
jgi:drug/metabolite transporter (DMT)-like permease